MSQRLWIEVLGDDARRVELPEAGALIIGSSGRRAGLVLAGQGVDRTHCGIGRLKDGGWAIKDLGSRYGTFVNGSAIASQRLAAGDSLVLGSRRLRVVTADAAPAERASAGAPAPPARIAGYRVERLLGRGAMGRVFLAEQESLSRLVALKVLSPELAGDADFVRRFEREARAAAALNHPNVVVVYDVGESEGQHYLSMEYMEGGSLEERVAAAGRLPWREVLDVLHDAASGLVYAEDRGLVHRDIKPANLMLTSTGTVKIADLGLAVQGDAERGPDAKVYGTPHFISPEQARGEPVDHRSDLYSLGATAYRLLSGRTPFEGESTRAILRAHFTVEPPSLRGSIPDLPAELDAIVLRLLAKDPDARFPSAGDLLAEVDRLRLASGPAAALPRAPAPPRSPLPMLVALALLGVVGALAALLYFGRKWERERAAEVAPGTTADGPREGSGAAPESPEAPLLEPRREFFEGAGEGATGDPFAAVERDLETLDREAQLAYRDLPPASAPAARARGLRALADRYDGTATARRAEQEIPGLEQAQREADTAVSRLVQAAEEAGREMCASVPWPPPEGTLPRPAEALQRARDFTPAAPLRGHVAFAEQRSRLENRIVADSRAALAAELARADAFAAHGDFDSVGAVLDTLLEHFDLSGYAAPHEPLGMPELRAEVEAVAARRAALAEEAATWEERRGRLEQARIASSLGIGSGFLDELSSLDLEAMRRRTGELHGELYTQAAQELVATLERGVTGGEHALAALRQAFEAGGWRRHSIVDPRGRRGTGRAIEVRAEGVLLEDGGTAGLVPWSAFGATPDAIHQLFYGRLERDYSVEETRDIATLALFAALADGARGCRAAMAGEAPAPEVGPLFAIPAEWAESLPDDGIRERIRREREAAERAAALGAAAREGAWSEVLSGAEGLLARYGDTLLVALLSDGSDWSE